MSSDGHSHDKVLTLAMDGDSRQRRWADSIGGTWQGYDPFWQKFIVPMTYRIVDPTGENRFLRPSISQLFVDLADADYGAFFHLAQAHAWKRRLADEVFDEDLGQSEALYCFYAHAMSAVDATLWFAQAVNEIANKYRGNAVFALKTGAAQAPTRIVGDWGTGDDRKAWSDFDSSIREIRNHLLHRRPVFIQNQFMPKPERKILETASGLAAIVRRAQDPDRSAPEHVPVEPTLRETLTSAGRALSGVWNTAHIALTACLSRGLKDDLWRVTDEDRALKLDDILRIRSLRVDPDTEVEWKRRGAATPSS